MNMTTTERTFEDHIKGIEQTAIGLAIDAGTFSPDTLDSPGARFLTGIQDAVLDQIETVIGDESEAYDLAHEIADGAVPVYTYPMWQAFLDLGAYSEDTHGELGDDGSDLTKSAQYALYLIGSRLAHRLIESVREAHAEWVEDHEAEESEEDTDEGEGIEA